MPLTTEPDSYCVPLVDAAATLALGARLANCATPGLLITLDGPLGVGKTTLARGFIQTWTGSAEEAPSPTYTLVQTYDGARGGLWHLDLYRLKLIEEIEELGLEEALGEAVCLVEWASRFSAWFAGRPHLSIALTLAPEGRIAQIAWRGQAPPERFRTLE